ncbi:MAG TPA: hypothetical protein VFU21_32080, partial [Kofleriaceae bacterium]|nr:hypothetical protein [Kofleriaceae bacterium]
MRRSLLALASATALSCGTGRPPPHDPADEHRQLRAAIERLEEKVAALAARLDSQPTSSAPATSGGDALSVNDRIERLAQRQAELEA